MRLNQKDVKIIIDALKNNKQFYKELGKLHGNEEIYYKIKDIEKLLKKIIFFDI